MRIYHIVSKVLLYIIVYVVMYTILGVVQCGGIAEQLISQGGAPPTSHRSGLGEASILSV